MLINPAAYSIGEGLEIILGENASYDPGHSTGIPATWVPGYCQDKDRDSANLRVCGYLFSINPGRIELSNVKDIEGRGKLAGTRVFYIDSKVIAAINPLSTSP